MYIGTNKFGCIECSYTFLTFFFDSILILGLLFDTLQVGLQLGFERVETCGSSLLGRARAACRVQTVAGCQSRYTLAAIVYALRIHSDIAKSEIEPRGTRLFQVDPQKLQITALET